MMNCWTGIPRQWRRRWISGRDRLRCPADTLYFGGGTPSLLGGERLTRLIEKAAHRFSLKGAEITLEANPADADGANKLAETLQAFAEAGGNRLSLGMQSSSEDELRRLGRRHGPTAVSHAVEAAHKAGLANISLDLMLALEGQDEASVRPFGRPSAANWRPPMSRPIFLKLRSRRHLGSGMI